VRILCVRFADFRNLQGSIDLSPGINVLFGANGQGKSNILEAIFVVCNGRSFRPGQIDDLVRFGAQAARVELDVEEGGICTPASVTIASGQKKHSLGGREDVSPEEVSEALRVVFFGPEDLDLVKGGPSARRELVDKGIVVYHPPYSRLLRSYQRVLRERNLLLRDFASGRPPVAELVDAYEEELAKYGAQIVSYRLKYLKEFVPIASGLVEAHTKSQLRLGMSYCGTAGDEVTAETDQQEIRKLLLARFQEERGGDAGAGRTRTGPHADDVELYLNGRPARFFSSQGEQRALAVSLKIAQLALWKERFGVQPVLLLDDVLSELDAERRSQLLSRVAEWEVQTVLTTTGSSDVVLEGGACRFEVRDGLVARDS